MNRRELFFKHLGQTSTAPLALEITRAEGCWLYGDAGKKWLDAIGGISVCNTGHRHPEVVHAIEEQAGRYLHLLVYGELVQSPQVDYATALIEKLPPSLDSVFFTNSGTEATEGAMKLAKRITGRMSVAAFEHSYHGSTQGALSIMGDEYWRNAFRPLLPGVAHLRYNRDDDLEQITEKTAAVFAETVQAENGVIKPRPAWMKLVRKRCDDTGALLILDEIQAGFGRTGKLWGFEEYEIVPDILMLGKALGGGLPLGAFISSKKRMDAFTENPVLGNISTFGGHPLSCAAGLASFRVLFKESLVTQVAEKEKRFRQALAHPHIKDVRSAGLLIAVEFESAETCKRIVDKCIRDGVLTDWFLFAPHCLRIAPPLTVSTEEIDRICEVVIRHL